MKASLCKAEVDQILVDTGVISQLKARKRIAGDLDTAYAVLDVEELPELKEEEELGSSRRQIPIEHQATGSLGG